MRSLSPRLTCGAAAPAVAAHNPLTSRCFRLRYIEDLGFASSFIVEEKSDFALPIKADGRRRQAGQWRVEFWSADWSPWAALRRLRREWPALLFDLVPDYAADGHG